LSHLFNVRDVLVDGGGRDEIFFSERRLDPAAIEMAFSAISLDGARRAGKAGAGVSLQGFLNRERETGVGRVATGRRSWNHDNQLVPQPRQLSPARLVPAWRRIFDIGVGLRQSSESYIRDPMSGRLWRLRQKKKRRVGNYTHLEEKRVNNPPVGLVTPHTDREMGRKTYCYDPHLDPSLAWAGKAERTSFEIETLSLHVHERIDPRSIIEAVRRKNGEDFV
jgi:hypothetical protein